MALWTQCQSFLTLLVYQYFPNDLLDKIVLFIDDIRFIVPVNHFLQIHRITSGNFFVLFQ